MGIVANIVCKTAGIAGLSFAIYDAHVMGQHHSGATSAKLSADTFESAIAAQRSNSNASATTNVMQEKVANFRMQNPIVPFIGKIKGYVDGFVNSLGENIIPVTFSAIALGAKGFLQKAGAWGLGLYAVYQIFKELDYFHYLINQYKIIISILNTVKVSQKFFLLYL